MPLTVTFTIEKPEDPKNARIVSSSINDGAAKPATMEGKDFYKAIYSEALSDYRYFGTLRAAVAWAPALATGSIIAMLTKSSAGLGPYLWAGVAAVFVLIYAANHYLQIEQKIRMHVAKQAQDQIIRPVEGLKKFSELADLGEPPKKWIPDWPSAFLGVFLLVLGFIAYDTIAISTSENRTDDKTNTESGETDSTTPPAQQPPTPATQEPPG